METDFDLVKLLDGVDMSFPKTDKKRYIEVPLSKGDSITISDGILKKG